MTADKYAFELLSIIVDCLPTPTEEFASEDSVIVKLPTLE
jgi:hypothetical protein